MITKKSEQIWLVLLLLVLHFGLKLEEWFWYNQDLWIIANISHHVTSLLSSGLAAFVLRFCPVKVQCIFMPAVFSGARSIIRLFCFMESSPLKWQVWRQNYIKPVLTSYLGQQLVAAAKLTAYAYPLLTQYCSSCSSTVRLVEWSIANISTPEQYICALTPCFIWNEGVSLCI